MPEKETRQNSAQRRRSTPSTSNGSTSSLGTQQTHGAHIEAQGGSEVNLTRRHFLYGVAGVVVVAAVAGGGYAISRANNTNTVNSADVLNVASDDVFTTEDCTDLENPESSMRLLSEQELDFGTLIWASDDDIAVCLMPTETANPLTHVGLLTLADASCTTIIEHALNQDDGFEIYDVRADSNGIIWVEANILQGIWRVYHAPFNKTAHRTTTQNTDTRNTSTDDTSTANSTTQTEEHYDYSLGEAILAAAGDTDWEMPTLTVVDNYAFWQVIPRLDGSATSEDSKLFRATFGENDTETVYVSHGRMACSPSCTAGGIVIAPRADTSDVRYELICLNASSGDVIDTLMLPQSMKPIEIGYGQTGFSFAFDAIYNYGDGISNLGTYTPSSEVISSDLIDESGPAYSSATWFRYPRTPTAAPAWCDKWFIVKSTSAVCGIDLNKRQYFALDVEEGTDDYGDYLASSGVRNRIVTYSNINYTTVDGTQSKYCLVRTWEPVT